MSHDPSILLLYYIYHRSSVVSVIVNLLNENDNIPNLPCPSFPLQVEENSPMGHPVADLNVRNVTFMCMQLSNSYAIQATDADRDQLNYMINVNDSSPEEVETYFSFR